MSARLLQTVFLALLIAAAVLVFTDRVMTPIARGLDTAGAPFGQ